MITIDSASNYVAFIGDVETLSCDLVSMIEKYTQLMMSEDGVEAAPALAAVLVTAATKALEHNEGLCNQLANGIFMAADNILTGYEFEGMNPPENVYQTNSPFNGESTQAILKRASEGFVAKKKNSKKK